VRTPRTRLLLALGAVGAAAFLAAGCGSSSAKAPTLGVSIGNMKTLPGIRLTKPPWSAGWTDLRPRLETLGLPVLAQEALAFHIHSHLDIFVNGKRQTVPAFAGINPQGQFIAPLHTHDATGVIHVESPIDYDYTLGQFMGVWGVRLSKTCLGGLCATGDKTLRTWVNGKPFVGDPTRIVLTAHEEIVVAYGTAAQIPDPVPSKYRFAAGL
jgi:hypothetical protein